MNTPFLTELSDSVPIENYSPESFQELNQKIYGSLNSIVYEPRHLLSFVSRHAIRLLRAERKEQLTTMPYHEAMAYFWACGLANRLELNVANELWRRFPGVCPYCASAPCLGEKCKTQETRRKKPVANHGARPHSLKGFQEMFNRIYPYSKETLGDALKHLIEETGEVVEALSLYDGTHVTEYLEETAEELTDVFTTLLAVANALDFDLAKEIAEWYKHGCPVCHESQCRCGFLIFRNGVPRGQEIDFVKREIQPKSEELLLGGE